MKHIILLLLLSACTPAPSVTFSKPPLLFVLGGQSNMAGAWQANNGALPSSRVTHISRNPLDWLFDNEAAYSYPNSGPAANIARALEAKYPGRSIIILNGAAGGSTMNDWRNDGALLPSLMAQITSLKASGAVLQALFWYQGESDAAAGGAYANWDYHLNILIANISNASGAAFNTIFAQLATTTAPALIHWEEVKARQEVASSYLPMIRTDDLMLCDDVHLDQSTFDALAARFIGAL